MMLMPLGQPVFFFPLVWLVCIFLLDPILYHQNQHTASFLSQAKQGDYGLAVRLLLAGRLCGELWEV
jgi:hypothetical protein